MSPEPYQENPAGWEDPTDRQDPEDVEDNPGRQKLYRLRKRDVAVVVLLGLAQVAILVAFLLLLREVVNALVPAEVGAAAEFARNQALYQAGLMVILAILAGVLRGFSFSYCEAVGYRIVRDLRMKMYDHLQGMSPRQFQGRARGGLLLRFLGDLSMLRTWISRGILGGIVSAITVAGTLAVMMFLNLWMTLAVLAVIFAGAALSLGAGRTMRQRTKSMRRRRSLVMSNIDEQMNALAVVQVFGRSAGERSRLSRQNDTLTRALIRLANVRGYLFGVSGALTMVMVAAVLFTGLLEVWRGTASIGMVVAFLIVSRQLSSPVRRLGLAHDYWHRAQVSRQKIADYLRSSSRHLDAPGLPRLRVRKGGIDFSAVSVTGSLSGITLHIEPGQLVAVTGPGGAGKSTLLGLVARTVDPDHGSIVIDGQLLSATTIRSTARWVGVVSPDLPLMRGTVRRNLTYSMPDATEEELDRIILASGLQDVLAELPRGTETWLTEGGGNLSLSQRQRIALGRALMGNPPILLLDEPTVGLDHRGREAFTRMLTHHNGTVLLATHDPAEIALADQVVVLDQGSLREVVSGEEYRDRLWLQQQRSAPWTPPPRKEPAETDPAGHGGLLP